MQNKQLKQSKKIYKDILNEIVPKLNNVHNINWSIKTWNFLIGKWIFGYVSIILDRLYLVKKIKKKNLI